jgi:hypothetical protein
VHKNAVYQKAKTLFTSPKGKYCSLGVHLSGFGNGWMDGWMVEVLQGLKILFTPLCSPSCELLLLFLPCLRG